MMVVVAAVTHWHAEKTAAPPSPAFDDSCASLIQRIAGRSLQGTGRGLLKVPDQAQAGEAEGGESEDGLSLSSDMPSPPPALGNSEECFPMSQERPVTRAGWGPTSSL